MTESQSPLAGAAPGLASTPSIRLDVITLMPEWFAPLVAHGVARRAFDSGAVQLKLWNPRDYADGGYRRVDDRPFGGGPGMVMLAEPLARTLDAVRADRAASVRAGGMAGEMGAQPGEAAQGGAAEGRKNEDGSAEGRAIQGAPSAPVILFSPIGAPLRHERVAALAHSAGQSDAGAVLVCGRYEGIDQRWIDACVTEQISLGDFVLSGGEIAALALIDAAVRLLPGVLGDAQSPLQDSFHPAHGGLLDCPHYTRPEVWRGQGVPPVLMGGNHAAIEAWRHAQRQALTAQHRPDLLAPHKPPGAAKL